MQETTVRLKKKAATISLLVGLGMLIGKLTAYFITGSNAIFSDAAESVVHVIATAMVLYSIILSLKPPDKSHLYGHGNIEYFSAGVEGVLIIIAAIAILYSAGNDLVHGVTLQKLGTGTFIITGAGLLNLILGFYLIRKGKATNSLALVADGKHVLTDSYTSIGVVVGLILVMLTGIKLFDPIIAIIVATNIIYTGYKLIRESIGELMNETDQQLLHQITDKLNKIRRDYWIDIHHLRFWKSSDRIFIDFHLILPYYFTIRQSHDEEKYIEDELAKELNDPQITIHMDYCDENLCKYCNYKDCKYRSEPQTEKVEWTPEKLIGIPLKEHEDVDRTKGQFVDLK
jgi:cation diffusion facilitator family transporter